MAARYSGLVLLASVLLGACSTQPNHQRPALAVPPAWSNAAASCSASITAVDRSDWWTLLRDPAIDSLVAAALRDNPTLGEAAARVDRGRAAVTVENASRRPRIDLDASVAQSRGSAGTGGGTVSQASASVGPSLSPELDL